VPEIVGRVPPVFMLKKAPGNVIVGRETVCTVEIVSGSFLQAEKTIVSKLAAIIIFFMFFCFFD
jgi:hypothetical protein